MIFCLQSEKVKQLLTSGRYRPLTLNEPTAALHRDNFAAVNTKVDEAQICSLAEHQLSSLESLVLQQRRAQIRIARVLKDAELRHRKVTSFYPDMIRTLQIENSLNLLQIKAFGRILMCCNACEVKNFIVQ